MCAQALLDVLCHEAQRIFRDRLVDTESETKFDGVLNSLMQRQWKHSLSALEGVVYTALSGGGGSHGKKAAAGAAAGAGDGSGATDKGTTDGVQVRVLATECHCRVCWPAGRVVSGWRWRFRSRVLKWGGVHVMTAPHACAFLQGSKLDRVPVVDLVALVKRGMVQYEREEKPLNILLFPEILDHLVRIDRTLSVEGGALLLVVRPQQALSSRVALLLLRLPPADTRSLVLSSACVLVTITADDVVCDVVSCGVVRCDVMARAGTVWCRSTHGRMPRC